jgi:hypothetical protein
VGTTSGFILYHGVMGFALGPFGDSLVSGSRGFSCDDDVADVREFVMSLMMLLRCWVSRVIHRYI